MVEAVALDIQVGREILEQPGARYDLVRRIGRTTRRQAVVLLAFGLHGRQVRLVLDGPGDGVTNAVRGLKVGTHGAAARAGIPLVWGTCWRHTVADLTGAIAWAHRGTGSPLANPWTSHRDLLGYRRADFYDAAVLDGRVDPRAVHALAGGRDLPRPVRSTPPATLLQLLRVAGAVTGVLPSNRRCFRVFTHAARRCGYPAREIGRALVLTARRIRQLSTGDEPLLDAALISLVDPRLAIVP